MHYQEIQQDLFTKGKDCALAHCISRDCAMGAGIAKEFRRRFPEMPKVLLGMNPQIGDALFYEENGYQIFNLITKEKYWHKPTYQTFEMSIRNLKKELLVRNITKLAIPKLGAGLDRLDWEQNREIIQRIFADTPVEIEVCIWE